MSKIVINVIPAGEGSKTTLQWNRVQIKKSLDEICHSLTLELPVSQKGLLNVHDTIEVRFYNKYITSNDGNLRVTTVHRHDGCGAEVHNGTRTFPRTRYYRFVLVRQRRKRNAFECCKFYSR